MAPPSEKLDSILATTVFIAGSNRPFGQLTREQVLARADELRSAAGWGPTARVAPVARAWRELAIEMERAGASAVAEVEAGRLTSLAPQLWIVLPG